MSCIPCSKVSQSEQDVIKYYRNIYLTKDIEYYVYRLSANDTIKITKKDSFKVIYKQQIQPNLKNGAEYFNIQEFRGN